MQCFTEDYIQSMYCIDYFNVISNMIPFVYRLLTSAQLKELEFQSLLILMAHKYMK